MKQAVKVSECALNNRLNGLKCRGHYVIIYSYLNSLPTTHAHAQVHMYVPSQAFTENYSSLVLDQASALS